MKAHNVCILWSLLILSSIPYEKNMHGNKNYDFFSIIHSCYRCVIKCVLNFDIIMASHIQHRYASGIKKSNKVRLL